MLRALRTFIGMTMMGLVGTAIGAASSEAAIVSGVVQSSETREPLPYATVQLIGPSRRGMATDLEGRFRFEDVPTSIYELRVFYIGYASYSDTLQVASADSIFLTVLLQTEAFEVEPVIVTGERDEPVTTEPPGTVTLDIEELKTIPSVGESDPVRSLQLLPGVQAASDVSSGLYIRGGGPDQTLILLDRVPVYNPTHAFGLFSTFNADAVENVTLYKGAYPAEYTGRLGSVLDVRNRDGNRQKFSGAGGISTIAGRLLLEGPVGSGSWMASGRRTYLDPILNTLRKNDPLIPAYYFYDLNGGLTLNVGDAGVFRGTGYFGWDELSFDLTSESSLNLGWGNRVANFRFNQLLGDRWLGEFQLSASEYESVADGKFFTTPISIDNRIRDLTLRGDFTAEFGESHLLRAGLSGSLLDFTYRQTFNRDVSIDYSSRPGDVSVYLEDEWRFPRGSVLRGGLRTRYFTEGDQILWEPRLSGARPLSETWTLKGGAGIYHQYVQLVATEGFAAGDFYFPVDATAKPGRSWQVVGGLNWQPVMEYELSADLYYTGLDNLLTFDNNATFQELNPTTDDIFVTGGTGYATGIELFAQKRTGRLRGWIGYTLGWTRRTFDEVNGGGTYAPKYDRRHDLKVVASWRAGLWTFATSLIYGTGQAYTPAVAKFGLSDPALGDIDRAGFVLPGDKNSARLLPYNRLDVSVTKKFSMFGLDAEWFVQVFNLYNRRNEWFIQYDSDDLSVQPEIVYQLPVIPSLGVNFAF